MERYLWRKCKQQTQQQRHASLAVRLPAEFRFEGKEVFVERVEGGVLLRPKPELIGDWLDVFYASTEAFPSDFLRDRNDRDLNQDRAWFHHADA